MKRLEKAKFVKQGIYFLFNKGELQYIGKSISVFGRIDQHRNEFDFDYVWFAPVKGDDYTLRKTESILIDLYQPPKNKQKTNLARALIPFEEKLQDLINDEAEYWEELIDGEETGEIISDWLGYHKIKPPSKHDLESVVTYVIKVVFKHDLYGALWSYAHDNPNAFSVCSERSVASA